MKTQALRQALDKYGFDAAIGGARRDEEKSRAKERVFSFRNAQHRWDPKRQRPEPWRLYNTRKRPGESMRVFPLSNWTELDIWHYIQRENIPIVPLYFAAERPVGRARRHADHGRRRAPAAASRARRPSMRSVRFRTLGCYPLTGAVESTRDDAARDHPGDARGAHLRAAGPRHRPATAPPRWSARSRKAISDDRPRLTRCTVGLDALPARASATRLSCASSPAARSTTASRP